MSGYLLVKKISCEKIIIHPIKIIMTLFVLLVLFRIPRTFLGFPYIYSIRYSTRTIANQGELFGITIFEFLAFIVALVLYPQRKKNKLHFLLFISIIVFYNIFRKLFGFSNPFDLNSYEILFSLIVSFSCGIIILHYYERIVDVEFFMDLIILLMFLFQIYFVLIGKGKNGSYASLGIPSGSLAFCYSTYVLSKLPKNNKKCTSIILIFCSLIGLILTGSRTHLLLLFAFISFYIVFVLSITNKKKWLLIGVILIGFIFLVFGMDTFSIINNSKKIKSLLDLFNKGFASYFSGDASALERITTWRVALQLIKANPLGISCSVLDLQTRMYSGGATTFPHSYLLCYYLLIGIPALIIYILHCKLLYDCKKYNTNYTISMAYIVLIFTFYGGISTQYLLWFWLIINFSLVSKSVNNKKKIIAKF